MESKIFNRCTPFSSSVFPGQTGKGSRTSPEEVVRGAQILAAKVGPEIGSFPGHVLSFSNRAHFWTCNLFHTDGSTGQALLCFVFWSLGETDRYVQSEFGF